jgi:hypothetical protein
LNLEWDGLTAVSRIEIISLEGQVLKVINMREAASGSEIDVSDLAQGLYFLRIIDKMQAFSRSFVKM